MSTPPKTISLPSETILSRQASLLSSQNSGATSFQNQVDDLVSGFVDQATDPMTLASLTAGGLAYRYGKLGVMGLRVGAYCNTPLRAASLAIGLGSEVTAFEFTHRLLHTIRATGQSPLQNQSPHLWSWNGSGGWKQSLISDIITFGALKGAGHLSRESNVILQHAFASSAMVAGHQFSGVFGILPKPDGTLAEQFLHAEAVNLQLGAGTSLVHAMAPSLTTLERGLDLSLRMNVGATGRSPFNWKSHWAFAEGIDNLGATGQSPLRDPNKTSHILLMTSQGESNGLLIPLLPIPSVRKQILIGSHSDAHFRLEDPDLLPIHSTIAPVGEKKWEIFNHSKQSMSVNGISVGKWKTIEPGDEIVLFAPDGREIRRFRFGELPPPIDSTRIEEVPPPPVITEQTEEIYPLPFSLKKGRSYLIEGGVHWALMEDSPQGIHNIYIPDGRVGPGHVEVVLNEDGTLTVFKRSASKTAVWGEMGYFLLGSDNFNSFLLKPGERLDLGNNDPTDPTSLGLLLTLGENGQLFHRDPRLSKAQTLREIPAQADPDSVKKVYGVGASSREITVREGTTSYLIRPTSPKERMSNQVGFGRIEQIINDPHLEGLRVTFKIIWPYFNQDLGKFDQSTEIKTLFLSEKQAESLGVKGEDIPKTKFWIKKYKDDEEGGRAARVEKPDEAPSPTHLYRQGVLTHLQAKKPPPGQGIVGKVRFVQGNVVILTEVKRKNAQGEIKSIPGDVMIESVQYFDEHDKAYRPLEEALRLGDRLYWNPPVDQK